MTLVANGRGGHVDPAAIPAIAVGTMVSLDLDESRKFYEEFLGLECVRYAPDRMLIRDLASKQAMEQGSPDYLMIDVRQVDTIEHPQNMLNHWGFGVSSTEEVDRIHAAAKAQKDRYQLKVRPITRIHNAYGFYMTDRDRNWWEIEFRVHGLTNEMVFEQGDVEMF